MEKDKLPPKISLWALLKILIPITLSGYSKSHAVTLAILTYTTSQQGELLTASNNKAS